MWDVLAIAPTDDPKTIRRAYAARLKQIDPDRDRETFVRLRQALEWALASARMPPRRPPPELEAAREPAAADEQVPSMAPGAALELEPHDEIQVFPREPVPASSQPAAPPVPAMLDERANERALLIGLESALQRGDGREAAQLYVRAAATGALPLGETERMLARLFAVALEDPKIDGAAFRELARSFGWDRPEFDSAVVSEVRQRVTARLAAEAWYDGLVRTAGSRWLWFPRSKSRVARLLLRRIRGFGLLRIDRPALRATLDFLKPHAVWLRDRSPPEWVAELERRMRRRELIAYTAALVLVGFLLLDLVFVVISSQIESIKDEPAIAICVLIAVTVVLMWMLRVAAKYFIGMWRSPS